MNCDYNAKKKASVKCLVCEKRVKKQRNALHVMSFFYLSPSIFKLKIDTHLSLDPVAKKVFDNEKAQLET